MLIWLDPLGKGFPGLSVKRGKGSRRTHGVLGGAVVENARGGGGPDVVLLGADALHVVGGAANLLGGIIGAGLL